MEKRNVVLCPVCRHHYTSTTVSKKVGIGLLGDSPETLRRGALYVQNGGY